MQAACLIAAAIPLLTSLCEKSAWTAPDSRGSISSLGASSRSGEPRPSGAVSVGVFTQTLTQEPTVTFGTTVVIPSGLEGRVYHIRHNTQKLPDFKKMKPAGTIYASQLNVPPQDFKLGFPGVTKRVEWFAIDYRGRFWVEKPGDYGFALTADDGANLYIDGELVVDNDGQHPPRERVGAVRLTHGVHEIRVSYFQGPRFHVALVLKVAPPGEGLRIFSTDELKPPPSP